MKNIILSTIMMAISLLSYGQVTYYKGNLTEALSLANISNKKVIIMASATWCGPCKKVEQNVFTSKKLGDFIDKDYIMLKYYLDKDDSDNIAKRYEVDSYPTFLLLDNEGNVFNRYSGGTNTDDEFIELLNYLSKLENSPSYHEAKYKADPNYVTTYIEFLYSISMRGQADEIFIKNFAKWSHKEKFTEEHREFYLRNSRLLATHVSTYMIDNKKELIKLIGKDDYYNYILKLSPNIGINYISSKMRESKTEKEFNDSIKPVNDKKLLSADLMRFFKSNAVNIVNKDCHALITYLNKQYKDILQQDLVSVLNIIASLPSSETLTNDDKRYMSDVIKYAIVNADNKEKMFLNYILNRYKN